VYCKDSRIEEVHIRKLRGFDSITDKGVLDLLNAIYLRIKKLW